MSDVMPTTFIDIDNPTEILSEELCDEVLKDMDVDEQLVTAAGVLAMNGDGEAEEQLTEYLNNHLKYVDDLDEHQELHAHIKRDCVHVTTTLLSLSAKLTEGMDGVVTVSSDVDVTFATGGVVFEGESEKLREIVAITPQVKELLRKNRVPQREHTVMY